MTLNLEHVFDGRELEANYAKKTLKYINILWGRKVNLSSKGKDESDILFMCDEQKKTFILQNINNKKIWS